MHIVILCETTAHNGPIGLRWSHRKLCMGLSHVVRAISDMLDTRPPSVVSFNAGK